MSNENEFSELQAVDFGLGAFIAAALNGLNDQAGPKGFREFLGRPTNRQIYRHDAESPAEFLKAYRSAKTAEKTVAGAKLNLVELPLIYYFRKPGLTNGIDKEMTRRGRFMFSESEDGLANAYKFMVLPLVLDYRLFFLAWDKPTLDKIQLAWYAYMVRNETFTCRYRVGVEDVFDIPAHIGDHKSLLCTDESIPPGQDGGRVYAVSTGVQVATDVIFGAGVDAPDNVEIQGILQSYINNDYLPGGTNV
jgi:hypothetical protein